MKNINYIWTKKQKTTQEQRVLNQEEQEQPHILAMSRYNLAR